MRFDHSPTQEATPMIEYKKITNFEEDLFKPIPAEIEGVCSHVLAEYYKQSAALAGCITTSQGIVVSFKADVNINYAEFYRVLELNSLANYAAEHKQQSKWQGRLSGTSENGFSMSLENIIILPKKPTQEPAVELET